MRAASAVLPRLRAVRHAVVYVVVARAAFRRWSAYRIATVAATLEISVASMIRGFVLLAVVHTIGAVDGLDERQALTFAFLAGAIEFALWFTVPLDLDARIKSGDVITDLQRPVDLQLWWLATDAGRALQFAVSRGVPTYLFGVLVLRILAPASPGAGALFIVSLMLGMTVSFAWRFLIALTGFWLLDTRGAHSLAGGIVTFASGALLPLQLLPAAVGRVVRLLPFAAIVQTPFEVFTGERSAAAAFATQIAWALGLLILGRVVLARATRKVVVQGG